MLLTTGQRGQTILSCRVNTMDKKLNKIVFKIDIFINNYAFNYKPHSTRAASTSKALQKRVSLDIILKAADWASESTFQKCYHKQVKIRKDISWAVSWAVLTKH